MNFNFDYNSDLITLLPFEVREHIIYELGVKDCSICSRVSKLWSEIFVFHGITSSFEDVKNLMQIVKVESEVSTSFLKRKANFPLTGSDVKRQRVNTAKLKLFEDTVTSATIFRY